MAKKAVVKKAVAKKVVKKAVVKRVVKEAANKLFPGRPNYIGPLHGFFGMLHHEVLYERSGNVMERVKYVTRFKPVKERGVRLYNMIYLGENKPDSALTALAYIEKHMPDHSWSTKLGRVKGTTP